MFICLSVRACLVCREDIHPFGILFFILSTSTCVYYTWKFVMSWDCKHFHLLVCPAECKLLLYVMWMIEVCSSGSNSSHSYESVSNIYKTLVIEVCNINSKEMLGQYAFDDFVFFITRIAFNISKQIYLEHILRSSA